MTADSFLFICGAFGGLIYWVIGVSASTKLDSKGKLTSGMEWFPGIWSLSPREYSIEGKKLCQIGNIVMTLTVLCWIGWAVIRN